MAVRLESMLSGARASETNVTYGSGLRALPTLIKARWSVGRFESAAFGNRCLALGHVATGYQLEEQLSAEAGEPFYADERTHTFDKLIHLGQPWDLAERLTLGPSTLKKWVERVPDSGRRLAALLGEPVWQLLLPYWLSESQLDAIALELGARHAAYPMPDFGVGGKAYFDGLRSLAEAPAAFTCADDFGLVAVAQLLLELRYARLLQNHMRYAMVLVAIQDVFTAWALSSTPIRSFTRKVGHMNQSLPEYIDCVFGTVIIPGAAGSRQFMEFATSRPAMAERHGADAYWSARNMTRNDDASPSDV